MDATVMSAVVGAGAGFASAALANVFNGRQVRESRRHEQEVRLQTYRQPLVRAAYDLQSRIYNLLQLDLGWYLRNEGPSVRSSRSRYVVVNTCFVMAEYFGWVEVVRQEIQTLGAVPDEVARLERLLEAVTDAFAAHDSGRDEEFAIWRGEQRGIGELMANATPNASGSVRKCMGYATFSDRFEDPEFRMWFGAMEEDIRELAHGRLDDRRLRRVQGALIDLIEALEPGLLRAKGLVASTSKLP